MSFLRIGSRTSTPPGMAVLRGRVVTMDAAGTVLEDGLVCVDRDEIAAVVRRGDLPPHPFEEMIPLDTGGTIYPGLIELHNHLSYNALPLWSVPKRYTNRNQWRTTEPTYDYDIAWPAKILGQNVDIDYVRSIARYVECRSLFGGTTSTQGISASSSDGHRKYYCGLIRNVEAPILVGWPQAGGQTLDYAPAEIESKLVPALEKGNPFFYHLSEGVDSNARQRFLDLEYRPRIWAIRSNLIAIHGVALEAGDFHHLAGAAGVVWSPLSNMMLYGATADTSSALKAGVRLALGSDWSPSGSKNVLGELKIAQIVSHQNGGLISDLELVRMVTSAPAAMLGWERLVGSIEKGKQADLIVVEGNKDDPYAHLIATNESDIQLVMIGGKVRLGDVNLVEPDLASQELVRIGVRTYLLDLAETGNDPLAGLSFATATAKLSYGLEHMPELGQEFLNKQKFAQLAARTPSWGLDLELEDDSLTPRSTFLARAAGIDPTKLKRMKLEPATAVDDPDFYEKLKANPNLPDYLRAALP